MRGCSQYNPLFPAEYDSERLEANKQFVFLVNEMVSKGRIRIFGARERSTVRLTQFNETLNQEAVAEMAGYLNQFYKTHYDDSKTPWIHIKSDFKRKYWRAKEWIAEKETARNETASNALLLIEDIIDKDKYTVERKDHSLSLQEKDQDRKIKIWVADPKYVRIPRARAPFNERSLREVENAINSAGEYSCILFPLYDEKSYRGEFWSPQGEHDLESMIKHANLSAFGQPERNNYYNILEDSIEVTPGDSQGVIREFGRGEKKLSFRTASSDEGYNLALPEWSGEEAGKAHMPETSHSNRVKGRRKKPENPNQLGLGLLPG